MSEKTKSILVEAKAMNSPDLADAIEALEFLKDEATANNQEYKDLVDLVGMVKTDKANTRQSAVKPDAKDESSSKPDGANDGDESGEDGKPTKEKKLNYGGIRMIGSFFYSKKDHYQKGFSTADECAKHYNG